MVKRRLAIQEQFRPSAASDSPEEYGSDQIEHGVEYVTERVEHEAANMGNRVKDKASEKIRDRRSENRVRENREHGEGNVEPNTASEPGIRQKPEADKEHAVKTKENYVRTETGEDVDYVREKPYRRPDLNQADGIHAREKTDAAGLADKPAYSESHTYQGGKEFAEKQAEQRIKTRESVRQSSRHVTADTGAKTVKTAERSPVKTGSKAATKTAESSVKAADRTVKTAQKSAETTAKAAKATAKTAQKSAESAAKAVKATAQAAARAAKIATKSMAAAFRAIVAGIKSLVIKNRKREWNMKRFSKLQIAAFAGLTLIVIVLATIAFKTAANLNREPEIVYIELADPTPSPVPIPMPEELKAQLATLVPSPSTTPTSGSVSVTSDSGQVTDAPAGQTAAPVSVGSGDAFTLTIRGTNIKVASNVEEDTLENGPGWLNTSAAPGQDGVCVVYGHRNRNHLKVLEKADYGDVITVTMPNGTKYDYAIESIEVMKSDDALRIPTLDGKHLMLVTCYPFYYTGHAPEKYVVLSRLNSYPESCMTIR